ncbi:MAG: hypothetical protein LC687_02355, partial [Actinobacteria bacterium]|nr:hypothetical protein [Actinomycetota bacterium]
AGITYYVQVSGYDGTEEGMFALEVSCEAPPSCIPASELIADEISNDCADGEGTYTVLVSFSDDGTAEEYVVSNDVNEETPVVAADGSAEFTFPSATVVNFTAVAVGFEECNVEGSFSFTCPPPAPENDECNGAIALECGDVLMDIPFEGATQSIDDDCFGSGSADMWYSFVADGISTYTISESSASDVVVSLYTGDDCENLTEIESCSDFPESFEVTDAGTYFFRVRPYFSSTNTHSVSLTCTEPPEPIANDDCADALPIACGQTAEGTTLGASDSDPEFCGTSATAPGVWYVFEGTGDTITASLCDSDYDTKLTVFEGSCDGLTCVGGNDDACGNRSEVQFSSDAGISYYIYVHGFGEATGEYDLSVSCIDSPAPVENDDCANALPVEVNGAVVIGDNSNATGNDIAVGCGLGADTETQSDLWWSFTAPDPDTQVVIETFDISIGDTQLQVFDACGGTVVDCNDDGGEGFMSQITIPCGTLNPGQEYFIQVDGWGTSTGEFELSVTSLPCPPPIVLAQNITIPLDENGEVSITPEDVNNGSSSPYPGLVLDINTNAFDCSHLGENQITLTATDMYGNQASTSAMVTVVDEYAPIVLCQNTTVYLDENGQATIGAADVDGGCSDNCTMEAFELSKELFTCDDIGSH